MPAGSAILLAVPEQAEDKSRQRRAGLGDGLDDDAQAHRAVDDRFVGWDAACAS